MCACPCVCAGFVSRGRIRVSIRVRISARFVSLRYVSHRLVSLASDRSKAYLSKPGTPKQLASIYILVASGASVRTRATTRPHVGQFAGGAGEPENCFDYNAGSHDPTAQENTSAAAGGAGDR